MLLKLRFLHALLIKLLENTFSDSFSHQILFPSEKAFKRNKHKKNTYIKTYTLSLSPYPNSNVLPDPLAARNYKECL